MNEHMDHIQLVSERVQHFGLKIKVDTCTFDVKQIFHF